MVQEKFQKRLARAQEAMRHADGTIPSSPAKFALYSACVHLAKEEICDDNVDGLLKSLLQKVVMERPANIKKYISDLCEHRVQDISVNLDKTAGHVVATVVESHVDRASGLKQETQSKFLKSMLLGHFQVRTIVDQQRQSAIVIKSYVRSHAARSQSELRAEAVQSSGIKPLVRGSIARTSEKRRTQAGHLCSQLTRGMIVRNEQRRDANKIFSHKNQSAVLLSSMVRGQNQRSVSTKENETKKLGVMYGQLIDAYLLRHRNLSTELLN